MLQVNDTGVGIAEAELPSVVNRFYRAKPSRRSNSNGIGLGLAIVQKIVNLHGGHLSITSKPGKGTSVTIALPAY